MRIPCKTCIILPACKANMKNKVNPKKPCPHMASFLSSQTFEVFNIKLNKAMSFFNLEFEDLDAIINILEGVEKKNDNSM